MIGYLLAYTDLSPRRADEIMDRCAGTAAPGGTMRRTKKTIDPIKRDLFEVLDLDAVGPEGLAARFTAAELRVLASEAGQRTCGNKLELAAKIIAAGKPGR